jgi:hypothetical protein
MVNNRDKGSQKFDPEISVKLEGISHMLVPWTGLIPSRKLGILISQR